VDLADQVGGLGADNTEAEVTALLLLGYYEGGVAGKVWDKLCASGWFPYYVRGYLLILFHID
jgi:hypothetical protein